MAGKHREIDWSRLEGMVMFDASCETCALELKISKDTLERAIKRVHDMTFLEYKKLHLGKTILRLKQRMIKKALDGDTVCMIFTLKNISDWSDKVEAKTNEEKQNILINIIKDTSGS